jgi:signal peptidase I
MEENLNFNKLPSEQKDIDEKEKRADFFSLKKLIRQAKKYLFIVWELLKIIIIAAIIVLPIRYFLFQPFIVKGESMVPNFHSGDYLIVDEISYRISHPKRGDVIVLKYPLDASQRYIKRIIGLPGETVTIKDGKITVSSNEEDISGLDKKVKKSMVLDEKKYLPDLITTEGNLQIVLSEDQYFVLGDNRQFSYDSRRWGALPKKDIVGRAAFRVFPISDMSFITGPAY